MQTRVRIQQFIEGDNLAFDVITLLLSYAFILLAAWNDSLLGLPPNAFTWAAEFALAAGLACEISLRLIFAQKRHWYFYPLVVVDAVAVLTVIPGLVYITFARVVRLLVSGGRMLKIIDRISRSRGNPYLILLVYPFIVPSVAALFYVCEREAANAQVHNYFQSLILMMSYSATVGLASNHPVTYIGKLICGLMLLLGLMCVSIIGNALTDRYTVLRSTSFDAKKHDSSA